MALVIGMFFCGALFGDNIMDIYFNGDELNSRINSYINNVASLVPDTSTLQNVWSIAPKGDHFFGGGVNGSIAFLEQSKVGGLTEAFGADNIDLTQFPDGIPYLPCVSFDARIGLYDFDFGISGTWLDEGILAENDIKFFGEGSSFALQSIGFDFRYTLPIKGLIKNEKYIDLLPLVTVHAGYFFTNLAFGITARDSGRTESVRVDLRNDSYLLGLHVSKDLLLGFLTPYAGVKMMLSKTDSEFSWNTNRPVIIKGQAYLNGVNYASAGNDGSVNVYSQVYVGLGITYFSYLIAIGSAYTLGTNHFSINGSVRYIFGR